MPKLIYLSLMRLPSEKAHSLQIMQNCEALAQAGYQVELWVTSRFTTPDLRTVRDLHAHYGVEPVFTIRRMPVLDLYPLLGGNTHLERIGFYVVLLTYLLAMLGYMLIRRGDIYYSRDKYLLAVLAWFVPSHRLAYEAHLVTSGAQGQWLERRVIAGCGSIITITAPLRDHLIRQYDADPTRFLVAHDGIRAARFASLPDTISARRAAGWDESAFIVGFVGRLHMLNVDKGLDTLLTAVAAVDGASLALVGGPVEGVDALREQWRQCGLPDSRFLYAGQVPPHDVPRYLRAFDVCVMPHPYTEQFAHYTSPLKLFEYMAAERAIVASDLPGWRDVLTHETHALLVPPSDVTALTDALCRLRDDAHLRESLANAARDRVFESYTWAQRAARIRAHLERDLNLR